MPRTEGLVLRVSPRRHLENLASARQQPDGLDVIGLREHIERLHRLEGVAAFAEDRQVAGERGRLAGDVDDPLRLGGDQGVKDRPFVIRPLGILHPSASMRYSSLVRWRRSRWQ